MSIFTHVKRPKVKSSNFNLSEECKLSCNFGELIPILCKEVLPSDKFEISTELLIKLAPMKAPIMHRLKAKVDYFLVPNYQLTSRFEKFINPKVNTAANPIELPKMTAFGIGYYTKQVNNNTLIGSLADYLGLPVTQTSFFSSDAVKVSLLPFVAYQHIYNTFYKDENMQPDGDSSLYPVAKYIDALAPNQDYDIKNLLTLRHSAWKKDYFTSALPSPQAGDDVLLPLAGGDMSVVFDPVSAPNAKWVNASGELPEAATGIEEVVEGNCVPYFSPTSLNEEAFYDPNGSLKVDTSDTPSISINTMRKLFSLQRFKELAERGGTRYPELVQNFFGAFLPDIYFDRPIYLGGQVQPIQVGEVVQTSQTTNDSMLATRGGIASSYGKTKTVKFKSKFHGYVIGILRILPEATYSQGVERMWTRETIYDYAFPQFANLGEQEIFNREIYAQGTDADKGVFGYTPRYAEYKEGHCHICGEFRNTLEYWHLGRKFATAPALNKTFVMMDQMNYQPFAVTTDASEHCYVDLYNNIKARRPLPYFGTPKGL